MRKCTGIILSNQIDNSYGNLSKSRPDYMLPFGGRYRIIDFSLSGMSNLNLSNVMLYAGKNVRSTLDHVGNGNNWELNRRNNGLLINPPSFNTATNRRSEIMTYFDSLQFYEESDSQHIYIEDPMAIAKANLTEAYNVFKNNDYDVLLIYKKVKDEEGIYIGKNKLILDSSGNVLNVGINLGTEESFDLYMGRLFIKKKVFIDIIKNSVETGTAQTLLQGIVNNISRLKIGTLSVDCHVELISDIVSYYRANMNLLKPEIYEEMFYKGGLVYTKSKDEPSALYKDGCKVSNSLIANGAIIEGQVENSIVFRGVHVGKNSIVRDCILIQKSEISENAIFINAIADKYSIIEEGVQIMGAKSSPYVVAKNEVVKK